MATFPTDKRRDAAAVQIAANAGQWLHITLRETRGAFPAGTRFYGIPSTKNDGTYYYTNFRYCSCPDYRERRPGCKHQRAVAVHVARIRQEREGAADEAGPSPEPFMRDLGDERIALTAAGAARVTATVARTGVWHYCTNGCGELLAPEHTPGLCNHCAAEHERPARKGYADLFPVSDDAI